MIVKKHASERWGERFPDKDIKSEFLLATKRVGKKTRKKIKVESPMHEKY